MCFSWMVLMIFALECFWRPEDVIVVLKNIYFSRYTSKADTVFAWVLTWPKENKLTLDSVVTTIDTVIIMLGHGQEPAPLPVRCFVIMFIIILNPFEYYLISICNSLSIIFPDQNHKIWPWVLLKACAFVELCIPHRSSSPSRELQNPTYLFSVPLSV